MTLWKCQYTAAAVALTISISFTCLVSGSSLTQATFRRRLDALRTHLLSNYSGHFAPFSGEQSADPFPITTEFTLFSILELDSAKQILSTLSYLSVSWTDPDLTWDPHNMDQPGQGITQTYFSPDDIWIPKLILLNRANEEDAQVIDHYDLIVTYSNGYCVAHFPLKLDTICHVDVTSYPFDTQVCKISLGGIFNDNLNLTASLSSLPLLASLDVSGEWQVDDISTIQRNITIGIAEDGKRLLYHFVDYQVTLRREFIFYLLTILFPIVLLSFTGAFGFLLPLQCGEKVSFQVAIMVSLAVFLSFINDAMPKTSKSISRLAVYVDLLLVQSCLAFLATLTVLRGYYHQEKASKQQKEHGLEQTEMERLRHVRETKQAGNQTTTREGNLEHESPGGLRDCHTVTSQWKRMASQLQHAMQSCYCCCCCIPPQQLDKVFFIFFAITALTSPLVFLI